MFHGRVRIVVIVAAGLLVIALGPIAAQDATPDIPAPEECDVPPRSLDDVRQAVRALQATNSTATPAAAPPMVNISGAPPNATVVVDGTVAPQVGPLATPTAFVPPEGRPADAATVVGVTATYREMIACANAYDFLRAYALETDALFHRSVQGLMNEFGPGEEEVVAFLEGTFGGTLPVGARFSIPEIQEVRIGADGRVGAIVLETTPPGFVTLGYVEFVKIDDRWLFDIFPPISIEVVATPTR